MRLEVAYRRIESFRKRFGEPHLYLAYHAAFPLALTPDLLYRLWANFQRDIHGEVLNIPWIAVADLLLSSLCDEVGHELYEMDGAVRKALLSELEASPRFGNQRINDLSDFLLAYVQQQLDSPDLDTRDFAQAQRWTALAYTRPGEAAHDLALALSKLKLDDRAEWVRMASLVETFAEPLKGFEPLLVYSRAMGNWVRGDQVRTAFEFGKLSGRKKQVDVEGVILSIPEPLMPESEVELRSERAVDYTRLRDLLVAGRWKAAEKETAAVMMKASGQEKEGSFDKKSIENFPCTDLRTIDQLWIKYSHGHFGLTVQKLIWQEVNESYQAFGDRVGWRVKGKWIDYSELTFSLDAPVGHLSGATGVAWDGIHLDEFVHWWFGTLFSRVETCRLI